MLKTKEIIIFLCIICMQVPYFFNAPLTVYNYAKILLVSLVAIHFGVSYLLIKRFTQKQTNYALFTCIGLLIFFIYYQIFHSAIPNSSICKIFCIVDSYSEMSGVFGFLHTLSSLLILSSFVCFIQTLFICRLFELRQNLKKINESSVYVLNINTNPNNLEKNSLFKDSKSKTKEFGQVDDKTRNLNTIDTIELRKEQKIKTKKTMINEEKPLAVANEDEHGLLFKKYTAENRNMPIGMKNDAENYKNQASINEKNENNVDFRSSLNRRVTHNPRSDENDQKIEVDSTKQGKKAKRQSLRAFAYLQN